MCISASLPGQIQVQLPFSGKAAPEGRHLDWPWAGPFAWPLAVGVVATRAVPRACRPFLVWLCRARPPTLSAAATRAQWVFCGICWNDSPCPQYGLWSLGRRSTAKIRLLLLLQEDRSASRRLTHSGLEPLQSALLASGRKAGVFQKPQPGTCHELPPPAQLFPCFPGFRGCWDASRIGFNFRSGGLLMF